jgi:hypothetical protein
MDERLPAFLSVPRFLQQYPISRTRFYEAVRKGEISILKEGARTLVPSSELERLERKATARTASDDESEK